MAQVVVLPGAPGSGRSTIGEALGRREALGPDAVAGAVCRSLVADYDTNERRNELRR